MPQFTPSSPDLTYRPSAWDGITDEHITRVILSDRPVTSSKNIWAFWHSGWDAMPPWRQRNVISWVRRHDSSWQFRVLDLVPESPRHILNFVKPELLPDALIEGKMDVKSSRNAAEHASDLIRLPLLYLHGGIWMDIALFTLQDVDIICWNAICDPDDPAEFCAVLQPMSATHSFPINGFLASLPGNRFVMLWYTIFLELWKNKTSCHKMSSDPLISEFPQWPINEAVQAALGEDVTLESYNDYLAQTLALVRLVSIIDPSLNFSGPEYWNKHCLFYTIDQIYPLHGIFYGAQGYVEMRQAELFDLPRTEPIGEQDSEQKDAQRFVEESLRTSILKKFSKGPCTAPTVAAYWDNDPEAGCRPGSWGEYFRWATVHLASAKQPERKQPGSLGVQRIDKAYKMGLLERGETAKATIIGLEDRPEE